MKEIFTLGTSLRSFEDFIEIVIYYEIEAVLDVRSFPKSRLEHFSKSSLELSLKNELMDYHFSGKHLGGLRKGGYEGYTDTPDFSKGIDLIEDISTGKKSVIICAERFPWKCHRKFIARELQKRGWTVKHIIDRGNVWMPK